MKFNELTMGGHMSTAGGLWNAPARAREFGFRSFQIFSKNQMQWKAKDLPPDDVTSFRDEVKKSGVSKLMVHASYLLNLGTAKPDLLERSYEALVNEIKRCEILGIDYLVLHPGSATGTTEAAAIKGIADGINRALLETKSSSVIVETAAGQGSTVGSTFEEISRIIDGIDQKKRTGVCFDTCHVYASGHDIRSPSGYEETMDQFRSVIGHDRLKAFHLNDSKKGPGSRVDRHEQIGLGMLGIEGIMNFIRDDRLSGIPMILETPLGEEGYGRDLELIRNQLEVG